MCMCFVQLMLGDIVISVETAARQAEERGHTLLDEIRILLVGSISISSTLLFWIMLILLYDVNMLMLQKLSFCTSLDQLVL